MKPIKLFIYSAGAILLAAALTRFLVAAGSARILTLSEPMLGIPLRDSTLLVGALELVVAWICLFGKQIGFQIGWLAWLATDFVVYRAGLLWEHCHSQNTCIGSLTDPLGLAGGITGFISGLMPYYLLLGSYAAVIWLWQEGKIHRTLAFLKMFCPSCGGKIQFASQNLGRKIPCPLCQKALTLRAPENLKISCSFCHDHIEFPVHALGQKISCPHCNMTVILKELA